MKILVVFITISINLVYSKLVQVVSLSRHGARYHEYNYGNSSQTNALSGQLTAVGMRQLQNLGRILRKQYIYQTPFLNPQYDMNQIQAYSTPINRTQASITSLLKGLYPSGTGTKLDFVDKQLHIPPYHNKTDSAQQNFALPAGHQPIKYKIDQTVMTSDCPRYTEYLQINQDVHDDQIQQMMIYYKPFLKRLSEMYNFSIQDATIKTFLNIYDVVNVDTHLGRPLPPGLTDDDKKNLIHFANWYYYLAMGGNNTAMSVSGKLSKIFSVFDRRTTIPESYSLKWTFMSGHDTDVLAMHLALNLSSMKCIQQLYRKGETSALNCQQGGNFFATNLIFQLYSDDNKFFSVKVRSNGKYVKLCGKDSFTCDYFTFKNSLKGFVLSNLQQVCGKKLNEQITQKHETIKLIDM